MEEIGEWFQNPQKNQYPGLARKIPQNLQAILDNIYE